MAVEQINKTNIKAELLSYILKVLQCFVTLSVGVALLTWQGWVADCLTLAGKTRKFIEAFYTIF